MLSILFRYVKFSLEVVLYNKCRYLEGQSSHLCLILQSILIILELSYFCKIFRIRFLRNWKKKKLKFDENCVQSKNNFGDNRRFIKFSLLFPVSFQRTRTRDIYWEIYGRKLTYMIVGLAREVQIPRVGHEEGQVGALGTHWSYCPQGVFLLLQGRFSIALKAFKLIESGPPRLFSITSIT